MGQRRCVTNSLTFVVWSRLSTRASLVMAAVLTRLAVLRLSISVPALGRLLTSLRTWVREAV